MIHADTSRYKTLSGWYLDEKILSQYMHVLIVFCKILKSEEKRLESKKTEKQE